MTDGLSQQETVASQNQEINSNTPVSQEVETSSASYAPESKALSQAEVNELVGNAKNKGYQKGYQEALAKLQEQQAKQGEQQPQHTQQQYAQSQVQPNVQDGYQQSYNQSEQLTPEQVQQMIAEQWQNQQQMSVIHSNVAKQITSGREKYSDFDAVVSGEQIPDLIIAATSYLENGEDVIYDIAKNPSKLDRLEALINNPQKLNRRLVELSQNIKQNHSAKSQSLPKDPLSRVNASNVGTDNGTMTVRDYKNMFRG